MQREENHCVDRQPADCCRNWLSFSSASYTEASLLNHLQLRVVEISQLSIFGVEKHVSAGYEAQNNLFQAHLWQLEMEPVEDIYQKVVQAILSQLDVFLLACTDKSHLSEAIDHFEKSESENIWIVRKLDV